ncbi:unnamed protein product [Ilex paraguariensis]|uniref:WW domain-containing protein n=1 Tax=Ilex paraguariensis TaxID=185542 RepID=A0ABC8S286_9AQUA
MLEMALGSPNSINGFPKGLVKVFLSTHIWRQGTSPIWWGAELKITAAEAEIYVLDRDPYKGSAQYYQRLSKRYDVQNLDIEAAENQKKSALVPIVCVNLRRNGEGKSESLLSTNNYGGYIAPLPLGWEKRSDVVTGNAYYIDHNTRTTTWNHPYPDKPWKRFDMTFEEFKRSTILSPISQLADIFLLAGDVHAILYTGSKAMHSQILSIFNEEAGKFIQFSAAQNMKITLQRRYKMQLLTAHVRSNWRYFLD